MLRTIASSGRAYGAAATGSPTAAVAGALAPHPVADNAIAVKSTRPSMGDTQYDQQGWRGPEARLFTPSAMGITVKLSDELAVLRAEEPARQAVSPDEVLAEGFGA